MVARANIFGVIRTPAKNCERTAREVAKVEGGGVRKLIWLRFQKRQLFYSSYHHYYELTKLSFDYISTICVIFADMSHDGYTHSMVKIPYSLPYIPSEGNTHCLMRLSSSEDL